MPLSREIKKAFAALDPIPHWDAYLMKDKGKTDIFNLLGQKEGFDSYLELCTTTTGGEFGGIDTRVFQSVQRLLYNCPVDFDDGLPLTYRSPDMEIADQVIALGEQGPKPDICLVDSFHYYDTSLRDLNAAYDALDDGGVLVVHDCLPDRAEISTPHFQEGAWCGVSYKAYVDFVLDCETCDYVTLDCDFGCGVIVKNRQIRLGGLFAAKVPAKDRAVPDCVRQEWEAVGVNYDAAFDLLHTHKNTLLRLVAPRRFFRGFKTEPR
jgi:hypothetical protein